MTAPVRTRPAPTRRAPRTAPAARPRGGGRSAAAQRAYSRKTERTQRWMHLVPDPVANVAVVRRVPFVVLIIGLLGIGLITTLWLSTNSAESSYQLSSAKKETRLLSEQVEALHRDVATMDSAVALAQRASQLGMVPTANVARLVVASDGAVAVVGKPAPAAPPAVPLPLQPPAQVHPNPAPAQGPNPAPAQGTTPAPTSQAPAPVAGAPTPPTAPTQAHSEQIQPGPVPAAAGGGA